MLLFVGWEGVGLLQLSAHRLLVLGSGQGLGGTESVRHQPHQRLRLPGGRVPRRCSRSARSAARRPWGTEMSADSLTAVLWPPRTCKRTGSRACPKWGRSLSRDWKKCPAPCHHQAGPGVRENLVTHLGTPIRSGMLNDGLRGRAPRPCCSCSSWVQRVRARSYRSAFVRPRGRPRRCRRSST